jgi:peptidoglycan/xylan/chitin deacetylase (PgdA/CDA1 family)
LTWNEVRELRQAGIQFGSHTVNHPRLVELPWREIAEELRESKQELEQQLGEPVTTFAYPFAFPQAKRAFVRDFRRLLAEIGYTCCATTELGRVGLGDDPYRLKRLPANSLDDPGLFRAKLEGCYDWLGLAQAMIKTVKRSCVASQRQSDLAARARYAGSN